MHNPWRVHLAGPGSGTSTLTTAPRVIRLPIPPSSRLAELLFAARAPGQPHELRDEPAARASFVLVARTWAGARQRQGRGRVPAVALASVGSLLLATTGLAVASALPRPAAIAVDGLLRSIGLPVAAGQSAGQQVHGNGGTIGTVASATGASSVGHHLYLSPTGSSCPPGAIGLNDAAVTAFLATTTGCAPTADGTEGRPSGTSLAAIAPLPSDAGDAHPVEQVKGGTQPTSTISRQVAGPGISITSRGGSTGVGTGGGGGSTTCPVAPTGDGLAADAAPTGPAASTGTPGTSDGPITPATAIPPSRCATLGGYQLSPAPGSTEPADPTSVPTSGGAVTTGATT
jgi:hypothetical protein